MHVAHFIQRYPPALGGSEAYFQRLSRYLVQHGAAVSVWTTTARDVSAFWSPEAATLPEGESRDAGVAVQRFPLWRMKGRRWLLKPLSLIPLRTWQALTLPCNPISLSMWRAVQATTERFDAVHATAFPYAWPIVCAERLARRQNIPFLLTPFLHLGAPDDPKNTTRRQYTQPALRRLLLRAVRVFVQTEAERDAAIDLGVRPERAILQGLGVDPADCTGGDRARVRQSWAVPPNDIVIGHLANLSVEKGTVDLLRAFQQIQRGRHEHAPANFRLMLAGPAMPNYLTFRNDLKRPPRLTELGVLSEQDKRDFFAGIDVFVLPSRSDSFGLVLLEAWANQKPVIAYRAGGPAELIQPGIDGHLVRCGAIDELADRIVEVSFDAEQRRRLGQAGCERIARDFGWSDKLRLVRSVVADAIEEHRRRARPLETNRSSEPAVRRR
jgi:glycosyltransferase involved in cell wall biosynthesis